MLIIAFSKDHSNAQNVQFYAAQSIRESIGQQFGSQPRLFFTNLQVYLLQYILSCTGAQQLARFVRQQLLSCVAVIVKRGWLDDLDDQRKFIFDKIAEMLHGDSHHVRLGFCFRTLQPYSPLQPETNGHLPNWLDFG